MPIAGFDPSLTHFGWVILDPDKKGKDSLLDHGTFVTVPKDGLMVQRIIIQRERVKKLLKDWNISFVSMEAPYFGDFNTEVLFALNQFIHEVFLNQESFVVYFQPSALKKLAIPNMSSSEVSKNHMVHAAKNELDKQGKRFSEHVSDAYFAGKVGGRFYNWFLKNKMKDEELTALEFKAFCGKHTFTRGAKKGITEYKGIIYKENEQFFDYRKKRKKSLDIKKEISDGQGCKS